MNSFSDVRKKQRETAAAISASLTVKFLIVASRVIPNVVNTRAFYTDWDMVALRKRIPMVTKLIRTRPALF